VKLASTTTDAPSEIDQNLEAILDQPYGFPLGHAGDHHGEELGKPFETIISFRNVLGTLVCRVEWRGHCIDGDTLL